MSNAIIERARLDESLRSELRAEIRRHLDACETGDARRLATRLAVEPGLVLRLEEALAGAAARHGLSFDFRGDLDRELSDTELDLIAGGPTAVEYAVMLSLILVVC